MVKILLSVLVPMLMFVYFNCLANALNENDFGTRIIEIVVRKPTDEQIRNAFEASDLFLSMRQISFLKKYIHFRQYSNSFIKLLNTHKTLSGNRIELSEEEIAALTSRYDTVVHNKIKAQVTFYKKIQEIQCTCYVLLRSMLWQIKSSTSSYKYICHYVHEMIKMLYEGRLAVGDWLWRLHINLNTVDHRVKLELDRVFTKEYLDDIDQTLDRLAEMCLKDNYLTEDVGITLGRFRLLYKFSAIDMSRKVANVTDNDGSQLFNNDSLLLKKWWNKVDFIFKPIPGVKIVWGLTELKYYSAMKNVMGQYRTGEWIKDPFKHIEYHAIVLDIISVRLYCYIWLHLAVYQNSTIDAQSSHFKFMQFLHDNLIKFAYFEKETLSDVLILLSNINTPDDDMLNKVMDVLKNAVNTILSELNEQHFSDQWCYVYYEFDDENQQSNKNYSKFLANLSNKFNMEFQDIEFKMNGMSLNTLLFFIKGHVYHDGDIFFPNI